MIEKSTKLLEARIGVEPTNKGFADLCLTTWLPRLLENAYSTDTAPGPAKSNYFSGWVVVVVPLVGGPPRLKPPPPGPPSRPGPPRRSRFFNSCHWSSVRTVRIFRSICEVARNKSDRAAARCSIALFDFA